MADIKIDVFVHHAADPRLDEILRLLRQQRISENKIMADLTSLAAAVARVKPVEDSAITLLTGLKAQLDAAGTDSAITLLTGLKAQLDAAGTDPAALQALSDQLGADSDALAAAIMANTPAAPTP